MKKIGLFLSLFFITMMYSQKVSEYKFIVIPKKFASLKNENQYNLNALTKMVFEKQGYEVYYENDVLPQELAENRCKALYAQMVENSSLFVTKIKIELKDCKNQLVYTSSVGESREKEHAQAYVQAFREVGKSIAVLEYKPIARGETMSLEDKPNNFKQKATEALFAQPISNGFQLVDSTPKVVMKLFKTSVSNFYIAQKDSQQGVVVNKNNRWYFEYYQNDSLVSEEMEIKF